MGDLQNLMSRIAAFASGRPGPGCMSELHVAVMQYGCVYADEPKPPTCRLVDLARRIFVVFVEELSQRVTGTATDPGVTTAGPNILDLLPTVARAAIAASGPAYDGCITAAILLEVISNTNRAVLPCALLPVLNLFVELPGSLSARQSEELCVLSTSYLQAVPVHEYPQIAKTLAHMAAKECSCLQWPVTLRNLLRSAPVSVSAACFCAVGRAGQHAPRTGGVIIDSFYNSSGGFAIDVHDSLLLLILSQTLLHRDEAFLVLSSGFSSPGTADIISRMVRAALHADVQLAIVLVELGLYWCNSTQNNSHSAELRNRGIHVLRQIFVHHAAARREILNTAFSAAIEESSPRAKLSYCKLLEGILVEQRDLAAEYAPILHTWVTLVSELDPEIQRRILNAILYVAAGNSNLTGHIFVTMKQLLMSKRTEHRTVALHGMCAMLRKGLLKDAGHVSDVATSLKSAFEMEFPVRKRLYLQLARIFDRLHTADFDGKTSTSVIYLQQQVWSQFAKHFIVNGQQMSASLGASATSIDPVSADWGTCFECIGQQAYLHEPLTELTGCILCLVKAEENAVSQSTSNDTCFMDQVVRTVAAMVRQCGCVSVMCDWKEDSISMEQKLDLLIPLQELLLKWLPFLRNWRCKDHSCSPHSDTVPPKHLMPLNTSDHFWLAESHAMLCSVKNVACVKSTAAASISIGPLAGIMDICSMMRPYLDYLSKGSELFDFFELAPSIFTVPMTANSSASTCSGEQPKTGPVLRQRRRRTLPWWIGTRSDHKIVAPDSQQLDRCVCDYASPRIIKTNAFPCPLRNFTTLLQRRISALHEALKAGNEVSEISLETFAGVPPVTQDSEAISINAVLSKAFVELTDLYVLSGKLIWEQHESRSFQSPFSSDSSEEDHANSTRDDETRLASPELREQVKSCTCKCKHDLWHQRRMYRHIVQDKALRILKSLVPPAKLHRLKLQVQQESCFYDCRTACLDSMRLIVQTAQLQPLGNAGQLMQSEPLLRICASQPGFSVNSTPQQSASICAVYFASQLREEIAAGMAPSLLLSYVRWIECLLQFGDAVSTGHQQHRRAVAQNMNDILCSFEIDVPSVIKSLLQTLLDTSDTHVALSVAINVVQMCGLQRRSRVARAQTDQETSDDSYDLLLCATTECQHSALRVSVQYLHNHVKHIDTESSSSLAGIVDCLSDILNGGSPSCIPLNLRAAITTLVEQTISRTADVCKYLHDCWPTRRPLKCAPKLSGRALDRSVPSRCGVSSFPTYVLITQVIGLTNCVCLIL